MLKPAAAIGAHARLRDGEPAGARRASWSKARASAACSRSHVRGVGSAGPDARRRDRRVASRRRGGGVLRAGRAPVSSGCPTQLAWARRRASAALPLLADAPSVKKVAIQRSEDDRGAPATASSSPSPGPIFDTAPRHLPPRSRVTEHPQGARPPRARPRAHDVRRGDEQAARLAARLRRSRGNFDRAPPATRRRTRREATLALAERIFSRGLRRRGWARSSAMWSFRCLASSR